MDKNKIAIYVDFDECLIHGFNVSDNKQPTFDEVKKQFETAWIPDGKDVYAIVLRPGAREFLKSLQKITPNVFILTAGMKNFQTQVATAIGLIDLVKGLYGRDSTDVPTFPISVLIDDMWIKSPNTFKKSLQMGVIGDETMEKINHGPWNQDDEEYVAETIAKHFIQIDHFDATNPKDNGFAKVLPQIKPKLAPQITELKDILKEKIVTTFKKKKVSNI
jgi:hypothetical protein